MNTRTEKRRWFHGRCYVQGIRCEIHGRETLAKNAVEARGNIDPLGSRFTGSHGAFEVQPGRLPR